MQTVEKVPHIDHYRDMHSVEKAIASRPTLAELHDGDLDEVEFYTNNIHLFSPFL